MDTKKINSQVNKYCYLEDLSFKLPENMLGVTAFRMTVQAKGDRYRSSSVGIKLVRNNVCVMEIAKINMKFEEHEGFYPWPMVVNINNDTLDNNSILAGDVLKVGYCSSTDNELFINWIDFEVEYVLSKQVNDLESVIEIPKNYDSLLDA
eukprot:311031_1